MILTVTPNPCVDRTIYVDHLRPGEIVRARTSDVIAGGKGNNVARVVHTLGEPVRPVILAGGETGELIGRLLRERDGLEPAVSEISGASREVVTILEEPTGRQSAYVEPGPVVGADEIAAFVSLVSSAMDQAELAVLSGSVPCEAMTDVYARLIAVGRERGTPGHP